MFGFDLKPDELYKQFYTIDDTKKSSTSPIYKFENCFRNNLKGTFLTYINDLPISSKADAVKQLKLIKDGIGGEEIFY